MKQSSRNSQLPEESVAGEIKGALEIYGFYSFMVNRESNMSDGMVGICLHVFLN
jgi:hypothetical protein